jgi:hypothetical protein
MKRKLIFGTAVVAMLSGLIPTAQAATYRDYDPINTTLEGAGDTYHGVFNIVTLDGNSALDIAGFVPSAETITVATASFALSSTDTAPEQVNIDLGISDFLTTPGSQVYGTQIYGGNLTLQMIADLQADGSISYTLTLLNSPATTSEDVGVSWANLAVTTKPKAVNDGGVTLVLLGMSLTGLAGVRRYLMI